MGIAISLRIVVSLGIADSTRIVNSIGIVVSLGIANKYGIGYGSYKNVIDRLKELFT